MNIFIKKPELKSEVISICAKKASKRGSMGSVGLGDTVSYDYVLYGWKLN